MKTKSLPSHLEDQMFIELIELNRDKQSGKKFVDKWVKKIVKEINK